MIPTRPNFDGTRGRLPKAHIPGQTPQHDRMGNYDTTITGYACDCPTPDAPTRPAVVLDPFGGTGTTAAVASALGRTGISVDLSHDYSRVAVWRSQDTALAGKVQGRMWKDRQTTMDLGGAA